MSKSADRGSLMSLKAAMPVLPRVGAVETTPEMEERILGAAAVEPGAKDKDIFTDRQTSLHTDASRPAAAAPALVAPVAAHRKEPTVLINAKIPVSLHARLRRTAQFNDVTMTDILIRAIEAELATGRYAAPPETWGAVVEQS